MLTLARNESNWKVLLFYMHVDIIYKMGNDFHDIVCLSILLINLIKLLAKTIAYKRSLNSNISKIVCPIWQKFGN